MAVNSKCDTSLEGIINIEVTNTESELLDARSKIKNTLNEIKQLENKLVKLYQLEKDKTINFEKAKKQLGMLKKMAWKSNDPNVVELRNQLLLAVKLISK